MVCLYCGVSLVRGRGASAVCPPFLAVQNECLTSATRHKATRPLIVHRCLHSARGDR